MIADLQQPAKDWLADVIQNFGKQLRDGDDPSLEVEFNGMKMRVQLVHLDGVYSRTNTMNITNEELLPCPFCGGVPTLEPRGSGSIRAILCTAAPCAGSGLFIACTDDKIEQAVSAWNTRAQLSRREAGKGDVAEVVEAAMQIGILQAKKGYSVYTQDDSALESLHRQKLHKAIRALEQQQPATVKESLSVEQQKPAINPTSNRYTLEGNFYDGQRAYHQGIKRESCPPELLDGWDEEAFYGGWQPSPRLFEKATCCARCGKPTA